MAWLPSSQVSSSLKLVSISILLLSTTLFFLLFPPTSHSPESTTKINSFPFRLLFESSKNPSQQQPRPPPPPHCSSVLSAAPASRCSFALSHCREGLLNYASLHFCLLSQNPHLSLPLLSLLLLFHFYFLVTTARCHFSPVITRLSSHLRLSPSMAAVTLLALGNGAPDVFASVAAVRAGHARTGLGAILSAGAFVTAFVVGSVAILSAPFPLDPAPFVRDVFFYLLAASALFYIYLSAEIFLWQAVGFIGFYVFFVGFVFWMDLGADGRGRREEEEVELGSVVQEVQKKPDWEPGEVFGKREELDASAAPKLVWGMRKVRIHANTDLTKKLVYHT